jgi:hypothetical protein
MDYPVKKHFNAEGAEDAEGRRETSSTLQPTRREIARG